MEIRSQCSVGVEIVNEAAAGIKWLEIKKCTQQSVMAETEINIAMSKSAQVGLPQSQHKDKVFLY